MTLIMITLMVGLRAAQTQDIMAFRWEQNTQMVKYKVLTQKIYELGMRSKKGHMIKPGFHIIAPVATIAAVVEKRVSATVAIYGNTLFSDSSDKYDSGDGRR